MVRTNPGFANRGTVGYVGGCRTVASKGLRPRATAHSRAPIAPAMCRVVAPERAAADAGEGAPRTSRLAAGPPRQARIRTKRWSTGIAKRCWTDGLLGPDPQARRKGHDKGGLSLRRAWSFRGCCTLRAFAAASPRPRAPRGRRPPPAGTWFSRTFQPLQGPAPSAVGESDGTYTAGPARASPPGYP